MNLEEKENELREKVYSVALDKYDSEMLEEFIFYWTEPNKSETKVRWEAQKFFHIGRRLSTWAKRSNNWGKAKSIKVNQPETVFDKFRVKHGLSN